MMKISVVSLDQKWEDKETNMVRCLLYIKLASLQNCDLIIFPEMTLTGFSMNTDIIKEDEDDSLTIRWFIENAKKYKINIIFGVVLKCGELATNNAIVISSDGEILCNYVKIHPFSFAGEDKFFIGGDKLGIFEIGGVVFGLTICYDLRFPELHQALSKTASVIINIANWPSRRVDHWNTLSVARAIENQVYMIVVNRVGIDGKGLLFEKSSKIVDPSGTIVDIISNHFEMDTYNIDLNIVEVVREEFPVKKDRKVEFYKSNLF